MSKIAIIGSGFSGLSAAAVLSNKGHTVTVYEKNQESKSIKIKEFEKSKIAKDIQEAFPDAKLIDYKEEE